MTACRREPRCICLVAALLALVAILAGGTARADDWRQYRRDENRSGASRDRLELPLVRIWSFHSAGPAPDHRPGTGIRRRLDTVTVSKGRAYFVAQGPSPVLICADARTGRPIWRQSILSGASNSSPYWGGGGVAVTGAGVVYTYGATHPLPHRAPGHPGAVPYQFVAANDGGTGAPLGSAMLDLAEPQWRHPLTLTDRLVLTHQPPGSFLMKDARCAGACHAYPMGPPLIVGETMNALSHDDRFVSWSAGAQRFYMTLARPRPEITNPLGIPAAGFGMFPMASTSKGILIGDDTRNRFLAAISTNLSVAWHRPMPWHFGVPATDGQMIFLGVGGVQANASLLALNGSTGDPLWIYGDAYPRPDPIGSIVEGVRTMSVKLQAFGDIAARDGRRRPRPEDFVPTDAPTTVAGPTDASAEPPAYWNNPGVVVRDGRLWAHVGGNIACVKQENGGGVWEYRLPAPCDVDSMAASRDHLFVVYNVLGNHRLIALTLEGGKLAWEQPIENSGYVAIAHGLLFLALGNRLDVYAPRERDFRLAIDSGREEHYRKGEPEPADLAAEAPPDGGAAPQLPKESAPKKPDRALADAAVVRLRWGDAADAMVAQVKARRKLCDRLPMLVSLDWLNPRRDSLSTGRQFWDERDLPAFSELCAKVAAAGHPEHLDVAPEINVYLLRYPSQLEFVRRLIRECREAVRKASPDTRVLVSFNREVFHRRYGTGTYLPFGKVEYPRIPPQADAANLVEDVDELGITACPQSISPKEELVGGDYFTDLQALAAGKPVLVARISVWNTGKVDGRTEQGFIVQNLLAACYWLEAPIVAYPEAVADGKPEEKDDLYLRAPDDERPGALAWHDVLGWKRVEHLSARTVSGQ